MANGSSAGGAEQGSSSNPTQNPPRPGEDSPRRRQPSADGENAPQPIIGVPGQSAFTPYTRPPPPPHPHFPAPSSGLNTGGHHVLFHGAHAIPVGGGGYGGVVAAPRVGGSLLARKRGREGGAAASGGGGGNNNNPPVNCSVCGKAFMTPKALFGHMRSHPDRGWKGAHPPPAFRAEEEFADLGALISPEAAAAGGGAEQVNAAPAEGAREGEEEMAGDYRLPDLNNPPPEDAN